jgi:hypothetical protein
MALVTRNQRMDHLPIYHFIDEHDGVFDELMKDFCEFGYSMEPFCYECYQLFSVSCLEEHALECDLARFHLYLCFYQHFVNKFIFRTGNYRKWQANGKILLNLNNFPQLKK